jgi:ketosteroid isomerase-like protein
VLVTTLDRNQDALAVVERFNQAWNSHDLPTALGLTTDDCIFEATGPAPDGGRAQGRTELDAAWQPIFADTTSRFTTEEVFSAGDRVVVRWRYDWADGHVRGVDVIKVHDGLVAEKLAYVKG